jgi:predicted Ser/Thr protein kinase
MPTVPSIISQLKNRRIFSHGKRGVVSVAFLDGKKVAIKEKRFGSRAEGTVRKEAAWLMLLNRHGIGPKYLCHDSERIAYEFAEGDYLPEFLLQADKKSMIMVLKDIFAQCRKMDMLGISKLEMTMPRKHVIVTKTGGKPRAVMIDFERARRSEKPKNVTQFCQYLTIGSTAGMLKAKGIIIEKSGIIRLAREYKKNMNGKSFKKIISLLK